jgi:hypothetical protein
MLLLGIHSGDKRRHELKRERYTLGKGSVPCEGHAIGALAMRWPLWITASSDSLACFTSREFTLTRSE